MSCFQTTHNLRDTSSNHISFFLFKKDYHFLSMCDPFYLQRVFEYHIMKSCKADMKWGPIFIMHRLTGCLHIGLNVLAIDWLWDGGG